jgi:hypothetical protein
MERDDTSLTVAARKWTGIRMKNLQEGTVLNVRLTIDGPAEVFLLNSSQIVRFPLLQDTPVFHSELQDKLEFNLNIPASYHYVLVIDNRKGEVKRSFVLNLKASPGTSCGSRYKTRADKELSYYHVQSTVRYADSSGILLGHPSGAGI